MSRTVEITDHGSFIPASQRPDGSWRKPRRVKDGYVPQEEVPLYESKGKQWANSQSHSRMYPVGLDPAIIKAKEEEKAQAARSSIPGLVIENEGKKKKKKKKNSAQVTELNGQSPNQTSNAEAASFTENADEWKTVQSKSAKIAKADMTVPSTAATSTDPAKRIKNLKKKLREIEAIEAKISSGEVKKPDKDQLEKVSRKEDILSEIFALELSLKE